MKILKYILIIVILGLGIFLMVRTQTEKENVTTTPPAPIVVVDVKQNVENYVRQNISALSPVKAVAGGTWYVTAVTIDSTNNSGTVTYEDGHIQEARNFTYATNEKGEVVNVTIAGNPPVPTSSKSGITGTVTLSPTCPVERMPPEPGCAPKPYSTSINILMNGTVVKNIQSNSNGAFNADLAPGSYILQAKGGNTLPRCPEVSVTVKSGQYTTTTIDCDTGIR